LTIQEGVASHDYVVADTTDFRHLLLSWMQKLRLLSV
jgi:hypothetical protein